MLENKRDLALFNTAFDSKLRGCDLVGLKVRHVFAGGHVKDRASVTQSKTGKPVRFEITETTRQSLERWLLRGAVDWGVLNTSLKQNLPVRNFATEVRTLSGMTLPVEVSAVHLLQPEPLYVFFVRDMDRRLQASSEATQALPNPFAELSQLVGRRPIKDIVGETVDTIERMCIEAALELTHNNRASAAEMLGLSRQSLYVKLRRFGILSDNEVDSPLT